MTDNGAGDFGLKIESTAETASALVLHEGVAAGIAHIISKAGEVEDGSKEYFKDEAVWLATKQSFRDIHVKLPDALELLMHMPDSPYKAYSLLTFSSDLLKEGLSLEKARAVMRKAAGAFDDAYPQVSDDPFGDRQSYFIEGYLGVAELQVEAGYREDARRTALTVAPHIVALGGEIEELGLAEVVSIDKDIIRLIGYIGPTYPDVVKRLFSKLANPDNKQAALDLLNERVAADFIAAHQMDKAVSAMVASGISPTGAVWEEAFSLWLDGCEDEVSGFIDNTFKYLTDFYANLSPEDTEDSSMLPLLFRARKDHILSAIYQRWLAGQHDDMQFIRDFALWCGLEGDTGRLKSMAEDLELGPAGNAEVFEAYAKGGDEVKKD